MINTKYSLEFVYDKMGYGDLHFLRNGSSKRIWACRSGSINNFGKLVNFIPNQPWYICSPPEEAHSSEIDKMWVKNFKGEKETPQAWKWRLWPYPTHRGHEKTSHILIHPDGSLGNMRDGNGTRGCIGLKNNGLLLRRLGKIIFNMEPDTIIKVNVRGK